LLGYADGRALVAPLRVFVALAPVPVIAFWAPPTVLLAVEVSCLGSCLGSCFPPGYLFVPTGVRVAAGLECERAAGL
jgi:hypothetical protein